MSKRVTRKDCLEEAHKALSRNPLQADRDQANAFQAIAWIELARELGSGSLRIENDR